MRLVRLPNQGGADWTHTNAVDYNEEFDQILVSVPGFSEVWVIDHSTSSEQAAGHRGGSYGKGGDLLYRWGNPRAYRAGDYSDQKFFTQHGAGWIEDGFLGAGNILVFVNGVGRSAGVYSSVVEFSPPVDSDGFYPILNGSVYGPEEPVWIYTGNPKESFFGTHLSGAQRLPNGNTLVCNGPMGTFFELNPAKEVVWAYVNPFFGDDVVQQGEAVPTGEHGALNQVFNVHRYSPDYSGLVGQV